MNVILIGYRGTGKSAVARRLAERLGRQAIDADVEIESRAGRSIADIFSGDGEEHFRDLESGVLEDWASRDDTVLAAGGGAVLRETNRKLLRRMGKVVWLCASPQTILRRVAEDPDSKRRRPNLTTGGEQEVLELLAARTPIYRECADLVVDTEDKTPDQVAEEIVRRLELSASGTAEST